jgi:hypothetical protein
MNSDMMQTTYISRVLLKVHLWAARKEKKREKIIYPRSMIYLDWR